MVISANNRGALHNADIVHTRQFGLRLCNPVGSGLIFQTLGLGQQATAEQEILFGEYHAGARAASGQCRRQTCRTRANHQQIAVQEAFVVKIRVIFNDTEPKPAALRMIGS